MKANAVWVGPSFSRKVFPPNDTAREVSSGLPCDLLRFDSSANFIELPNGQIFENSGQIVELPDGNYFQLGHGHVVELPSGQILEYVDGAFSELRTRGPPSRSPHPPLPMAPIDVPFTSLEPPGPKYVDIPSSEVEVMRKGVQEGDKLEAQRAEVMLVFSRVIIQISALISHYYAQQKAAFDQQQQLARHEEHLAQEEEKLNAFSRILAQKESEIARKEEALMASTTQARNTLEGLAQQEKQLRDRISGLRSETQALEKSAAVGPVLGGAMRQRPSIDALEPQSISFEQLSLSTQLGAGSFAEVFKAEWRLPCAVKKLRGQFSREQMAEFAREADMMRYVRTDAVSEISTRSLRHPGIVRLLGVCVEPPHFYLVQVRA